MENKYQEALMYLDLFCSNHVKVRTNGFRFPRDLATLQELVDEKKPMKVKTIRIEHYNLRETRVGCPKCNIELAFTINSKSAKKYKYCPECGQKLDWSDEE